MIQSLNLNFKGLYMKSLTLPVFSSSLVTTSNHPNHVDLNTAMSAVLSVATAVYAFKKVKEIMNKPSSNVWRIPWKYVHCRNCGTYFKTFNKDSYFCDRNCEFQFAENNHIRPPLRWSSPLVLCRGCDDYFFRYHSNHKYCSKKCKIESNDF